MLKNLGKLLSILNSRITSIAIYLAIDFRMVKFVIREY